MPYFVVQLLQIAVLFGLLIFWHFINRNFSLGINERIFIVMFFAATVLMLRLGVEFDEREYREELRYSLFAGLGINFIILALIVLHRISILIFNS
jgi:hypothetical protein